MTDIKCLYKDDALVVCEKPVGVSCESPGLPDVLGRQLGLVLYPVHRLDQKTGGACVLALSPESCSRLQSFFSGGQVVKEYLAVVSGQPEADEGTYHDLLFHDRRSNKTFVVERRRKGVREAACDWKVIAAASTDSGPLSLLRIRLHTGRTHQIRVQFSSRKMPLAGDQKYGSRIKAPAPALWAAYIAFPHPLRPGVTVEASSLPPPAFPWSCFSPEKL